MVLGVFPFQEATCTERRYRWIYEGKNEEFWLEYENLNLSEEFKKLVFSMLSYNPEKRPLIKEIKSHSWMK